MVDDDVLVTGISVARGLGVPRETFNSYVNQGCGPRIAERRKGVRMYKISDIKQWWERILDKNAELTSGMDNR